MRRPVLQLASFVLFASSVLAIGTPKEKEPPVHLRRFVQTDEKILSRGRSLYALSCAPCHGSGGKGDGPLSSNLLILPTDLTRGVFANRSTICGELPLDFDLYHTVTGGIHNTAMPTFELIAPEDRLAIVDVIKSFSPRFTDSARYPLIPIDFGTQIPPDAQSLARGKTVYRKAKCWTCHGPDGKGDGPSVGVMDVQGRFMGKSDLTNPSDYRYSSDVRDLFRIFSSELDAAKLSQQDRWDVANYCWSLRR